jgi:Uma2 family endonuclease
VSTLPKHFITPEEYLELERKAETKSEYYNGEMFAMSGASAEHSRLTVRIGALLDRHLTGGHCVPFSADLRIQVTAGYVYPDLSVVCGEPKLADDQFDSLLNPTLVVEILSPSTERWDRGKKSKLYRSIPSLQEYVLISQEEPHVEIYRRGTPWVYDEAAGMDATIELTSIGYTLRLRDLYEGIVSGAEASA